MTVFTTISYKFKSICIVLYAGHKSLPHFLRIYFVSLTLPPHWLGENTQGLQKYYEEEKPKGSEYFYALNRVNLPPVLDLRRKW